MAGSTLVVMPRLGESIVEATVVKYRVAVGDRISRGQILVEIETDKATNEIPAPADGVVEALLVEEGATVPVGTPVLNLATAGAERSAIPSTSTPEARQQPPPTPARAIPSERLPSQRLAPRPLDDNGGPRRSSPAVRRLARAHSVDLHALTGSGRHGRVTRDDIERAIQAEPKSSQPPPLSASVVSPFPTQLPAPIATERPARGRAYRPAVYQPNERDRVVPFSRRRAQIAEHMVYSLGTAAHVAAVAEIDVQRVIYAKALDAPIALAAGVKLTFMPYVVQAVAKALRAHAELNATVKDQSLVLRAERNIGIAVDTAEGLVVPVIHRADELGLLGLARAIQAVSDRARAGQLTAEDVSGGSFTISNPGRDGNLFGVSIIRQPEVGILRIGSIVKRPVVREIDGEDVIVIRPIMFAALSYDHRVIDGRTGNAFLHRIVELLTQQRPGLAET